MPTKPNFEREQPLALKLILKPTLRILVSHLEFHRNTFYLTNELVEIATGCLSMVFNPSHNKIPPDECTSLKKYVTN
ncbi:hypothetical protein BYT27DRAFT_7184104 [Phlegmacium glaucopus]|nr:hypothetical protein BYT27DRAFT_7184104 [Phlegmacium glaucopus]